MFVRKGAGMTGSLEAETGLLTFLEGPYLTIPSKTVLQSDRLLLIGGGIGITGLLAVHPLASDRQAIPQRQDSRSMHRGLFEHRAARRAREGNQRRPEIRS